MYQVGQRLRGTVIRDVLGDDGHLTMAEVEVVGTYEFTTDDPEEYIQDVVLRVDGQLVYVDEQYIEVVE